MNCCSSWDFKPVESLPHSPKVPGDAGQFRVLFVCRCFDHVAICDQLLAGRSWWDCRRLLDFSRHLQGRHRKSSALPALLLPRLSLIRLGRVPRDESWACFVFRVSGTAAYRLAGRRNSHAHVRTVRGSPPARRQSRPGICTQAGKDCPATTRRTLMSLRQTNKSLQYYTIPPRCDTRCS